MNVADKSQKTETAFKLFDRNKDGYITREEFTKVATQGAKTFLIKVITINHSFLSIIPRHDFTMFQFSISAQSAFKKSYYLVSFKSK